MPNKKDILAAISESTLKEVSKKTLTKVVKQKNFRCDLNITLSKMLFEKRTETNKPNYALHDKLNYIYDDDTFNKNCIEIIKKL